MFNIKTNIYRNLIICFLFLLAFLILPTSKTYAYKIIPVNGPSGPADGTPHLGPFVFNFEFKVEREAGDTDTTPVTFSFTKKINGDTAKITTILGSETVKIGGIVVVSGFTQGDSELLYVFNFKLKDVQGKTSSTKWEDRSTPAPDKKVYSWILSDYHKNVVLGAKAFTLKNTTTGAGWYFITKNILNKTEYIFAVSSPYATELLCNKAMEEEKAGPNPGISYEKCTHYDSKPNTPANIPITPVVPVDTKTTYTMLAPLPGLGLDGTPRTFDTAKSDANPCPFGTYLNIMIKIFLGICGVLAVIMIVWGGIQYMTSELISSKE